MNYLFIAIVSFVLGLGAVLGALKLFPVLGLMDRPHKYGLKRKPIPYYGGLAIWAAFVIAVLLFVPLSLQVIGLLIGATLIAAMGFVDDLRGLSPYIRLVIQLLAAVILVFAGIGIDSLSSPLGGELLLNEWRLDLPWISISLFSAAFTVIWVMFIVNSINWIDGVNGLSSGIVTIAAVILFILAIRPDLHTLDQSTFATLALIVAAVTFAFWLFDFYPAKILMGDTGSMFLGFVLATLAIFAGGKVATLMLVLGFPILDAIWVISRRIISGSSPFKGDLQHLHHRLLKSGLKERQTLLLIYLGCAIFGLAAVFLGTTEKLWALILLFITVAVVGFVAIYQTIKQEEKK